MLETALAAIRANLSALGITSAYTVESHGTSALLERLARDSRAIDIVFLDPPWDAEAEYAATLQFLGSDRGGRTAAVLYS